METRKYARHTAKAVLLAAAVAVSFALLPGFADAQPEAADPAPDCVVIDDAGHCAPPGYLDPNSHSTTTEPEFTLADGRRCYRGNDSWHRGSLGFGRDLAIHATWCSNSGRSRLVSFSYGYEVPHQWLCSPGNVNVYTVSGGIGYSWVTKHYEVNYTCQLPFGWFSDRIWFEVRYGTHGVHYMVRWN